MRIERRGVTLLELLVALTLVGIVLASLGVLLDGLMAASQGVVASGHRATRSASGERLLRDLLARTEGTADTARQFQGDSGRMSFASWCDHPAGDLEPCDVHIRVAPTSGGSTVEVSLSTGIRFDLLDELRPDNILFLDSHGSSRRWLAVWRRGNAPPAAIGITSTGDTLVIPIEFDQ